tara:strand:- start:6016 stop:6483 length:468 start_codon:yes stop_codon:yes gene_type:complete
MNEELVVQDDIDIAEGIEQIKTFLLDPVFAENQRNIEWPLKHTFSNGIYARELSIPAGGLIVGKVHKTQHHNFLLQGEIIVLTEMGGAKLLQAPCTIVSEPGTQRVGYALTDTVWTAVHLNESNTQDLELLEKENVVDTIADYLEYTENIKQIKN